MKVNILNGWEVGMVDVFREVKRCEISGNMLRTFGGKTERSWINDHLIPPGEWSILGKGTASQCSEEEAKGIVERLRDQWGFDGYKNYAKEMTALEINVDTALESLHSYIRSNGKEPGNIVIVIRKKGLK